MTMEILETPMIDPMVRSCYEYSGQFRSVSNAMQEDELIRVLGIGSRGIVRMQIPPMKLDLNLCDQIRLRFKRVISEMNGEMEAYVRANHFEDIKRGINQMAKTERSTALRTIRKRDYGRKAAVE
jgi:polyribonucleotide nucleotidyltransferase